jgi:hypothetical protein
MFMEILRKLRGGRQTTLISKDEIMREHSGTVLKIGMLPEITT